MIFRIIVLEKWTPESQSLFYLAYQFVQYYSKYNRKTIHLNLDLVAIQLDVHRRLCIFNVENICGSRGCGTLTDIYDTYVTYQSCETRHRTEFPRN